MDTNDFVSEDEGHNTGVCKIKTLLTINDVIKYWKQLEMSVIGHELMKIIPCFNGHHHIYVLQDDKYRLDAK